VLTTLLPWAARAAEASDPLQFAPEGTLLVVHSNLHQFAKGSIDEVEARFAKNDAVKNWVARLRAFEVGGLRPGTGDWPHGLDSSRSVTVIVYDGQEQTGRKPVRLVIGSQAASQGVVSLAPVLNALLLDVVVQPSGLELKDRVGQSYLRCADHRPWLVCDTDTVPPPPGKRPDALASVDTGQKVTLSAFVDTRASREFSQVLRTATVNLVRDGGVQRLDLRIEMAPMLVSIGQTLKLPPGPSAVNHLVDTRGGWVLKLSANAERLATLPGMANGTPTSIHLAATAAKALTGEVGVTSDGGIGNLVFLLGLKDPSAVPELMGALKALLLEYGSDVLMENGRLTLSETDPLGARNFLTVHFAVVDEALVLTLSAADLARRVTRQFRPLQVSSALADRSVALGGHFPSIRMIPSVTGEATTEGNPAQSRFDWLALLRLNASLTRSFEVGFQSEGSVLRILSSWRSL